MSTESMDVSTGVVSDYATILNQVRALYDRTRRSRRDALMAFYEMGSVLCNAVTVYGENTLGRIASDLQEDRSTISRARQLAAMFPSRSDFEADVIASEKRGVSPSIAYYIRQVVPKRPPVEQLEARAMSLDAEAERLKALMPEAAGEIESIQAMVRQANHDITAHTDRGAADDYREWIQREKCVFCGWTPCDPAHLPRSKGAGGTKVIPVCHHHHIEVIHQGGMAKFLGIEDAPDDIQAEAVEKVNCLLDRLADLYVATYSRRSAI